MTPEGLRSEIPQYLWKRPMLWGLPYQWVAGTIAGGLLGAAVLTARWGWQWGLGACALLVVLGLVLQHQFRQDAHWDEMAADDLGHQYHYYYDTE